MFIFSFLSTFLLLCRGKIRHGNVAYNSFPNDWEQFLSISLEADQYLNYNITYWMRPLLLQHCTFIRTDERFCPLFVETHDPSFVTHTVNNSHVIELLLGFCSCFILDVWDLCSTEIHVCNYSMSVTSKQLYKTEEFPTSFQSPLPKSLCTLSNFCDSVKYSTRIINGIYSIKSTVSCQQIQVLCEDAGYWTFIIPPVTSSWSQCCFYPICNNTYIEEQLVVVASRYNCSIKLKRCSSKFLITNDTVKTVQLTKLCFFIIDSIQKDTHIHVLKELIDTSQKINEAYDNDYKEEFLLISPRNLKYIQPLRRRLLQNIGQECYGKMDYNTQGDKFNYRRHAQYMGPDMSNGRDENENEDDEDETFEMSDEKVDNNFEEDEGDENEEEEGNELGHQTNGQWIRMERSNRIGLSHTSKKQKDYLTKENVRIRSVSEECNEDPTEELQYYDYDTSGIDALLENTHKLQIGYFTRFTAVYLFLALII